MEHINPEYFRRIVLSGIVYRLMSLLLSHQQQKKDSRLCVKSFDMNVRVYTDLIRTHTTPIGNTAPKIKWFFLVIQTQ